jgi:hypothetical protein
MMWLWKNMGSRWKRPKAKEQLVMEQVDCITSNYKYIFSIDYLLLRYHVVTLLHKDLVLKTLEKNPIVDCIWWNVKEQQLQQTISFNSLPKTRLEESMMVKEVLPLSFQAWLAFQWTSQPINIQHSKDQNLLHNLWNPVIALELYTKGLLLCW